MKDVGNRRAPDSDTPIKVGSTCYEIAWNDRIVRSTAVAVSKAGSVSVRMSRPYNDKEKPRPVYCHEPIFSSFEAARAYLFASSEKRLKHVMEMLKYEEDRILLLDTLKESEDGVTHTRLR